MASPDEPVAVARDGAVMVVTLQRPDARNALDDATLDALLVAWSEARADDVRAVVLTGTDPAFCAGADLRAPVRGPAEIARNLRRRYNPTVLAMDELPKPIVAAVNGPAVGAGLSLAAAADVRVASERASFVPAFARVGAVPDAGGSWFVTRLLGAGRAFDWLVSGRAMSAEEALACGLVTEVTPHERLLERALARAHELAASPGRAVALTKWLVRSAGERSLAEQLEREVVAQAEAVADPARLEARARAIRRDR